VSDEESLLYLVRGADVTFVVRDALHEGALKPRAEEVEPLLSEDRRDRALNERRSRIVHKSDVYALAEDIPTQERMYVPRPGLADERDWRRLRVGDVVTSDIEFTERGPKAVDGSVRLD